MSPMVRISLGTRMWSNNLKVDCFLGGMLGGYLKTGHFPSFRDSQGIHWLENKVSNKTLILVVTERTKRFRPHVPNLYPYLYCVCCTY